MNRQELLWTALREPTAVLGATPAEWDLLVRQARRARVLGRLAAIWRELGVWSDIPVAAQAHLESALAVAAKHAGALRWEVHCVRRALAGLDAPVVLLKGAAYVMAGLPAARGRLFSDLDLMVPKDRLAAAEQMFLRHGWSHLKVNPYDQRYYRQWMHELPPLMHDTRRTVVDLHHTILPETGRLHPEPGRLFQAARPLAEAPFHVLAPTDMLLHSAAHLFQDGDLAGGIRDLTDLDDLLRCFGAQPGFWDQLVPRARELELAGPLFYALRFAQRRLGAPVPPPIVAAVSPDGPRQPVRAVMDVLVTAALEPGVPGKVRMRESLARWLLYVRSHWLRMPPGLLLAHLFRKALRRWHDEEPKAATIDQPALPHAPQAESSLQ
jgi:hypothetical protein